MCVSVDCSGKYIASHVRFLLENTTLKPFLMTDPFYFQNTASYKKNTA